MRQEQGGSQLLQGPAVTGSHMRHVMIGSQRYGQIRRDPIPNQIPVNTEAKVVKWGSTQLAQGQRPYNDLA